MLSSLIGKVSNIVYKGNDDASENIEIGHDVSERIEEGDNALKKIVEGDDASERIEEVDDASKKIVEGDDVSERIEEVDDASKKIVEVDYASEILEEGDNDAKKIEEGDDAAKRMEEEVDILDCTDGGADDLKLELKATCSKNKVVEKEEDVVKDGEEDVVVNSEQHVNEDNEVIEKEEDFIKDDPKDTEDSSEQQINADDENIDNAENSDNGDGAGEERHPDIENNSDELSLGDDWSGEDYSPEESNERLDENDKEDLESAANLDDDEDKKNPQYIPKLGMFYEHDDRIDPEEFDKLEEKLENQSKAHKSTPTERWGHDKFSEMDQIPKSKEELVALYGYDIRTEESAPRARRRRYGRGPNKYDSSPCWTILFQS